MRKESSTRSIGPPSPPGGMRQTWGSEDPWNFDGGDPDEEHPAQITSERSPEARRLDLQEWVVKRALAVATPAAFLVALLVAIICPDNVAANGITTALIAMVSTLWGAIGGFLFGQRKAAG
jgi:hypothetical protein